ncbi:flagellar basal body-associated protein FliL [Acidovorax sp. Root70]|uniref:flagellar basal body-associated FliL family protein n=1 Tax=Acidovorax sp. Root70 TaxID=1736590 RepID=UPI0006F45B85|nr:flagellar basal body-associated FliL family protein [Acidovorax sp. Root70]KRB26698.1 flagellar basal body protein FliL [Acidovorax sp. Root70]
MSANTPAAAAPAKSKKMLLIIIGVVVAVLVIGGGAAAWFISSRSHAAEDEEGGAPAAHKEAPKVAPTFLPMENMVVNLADPGGDRFAQIGITLELEDAKTSDQVKQYLPSIRSGILMLVSQRTSTELLQREGKEKLATDILREVSRPLGYSVPSERERAKAAAAAEQDGDAEERPAARKRTERNPVRRVLFSSFIIQ